MLVKDAWRDSPLYLVGNGASSIRAWKTNQDSSDNNRMFFKHTYFLFEIASISWINSFNQELEAIVTEIFAIGGDLGSLLRLLDIDILDLLIIEFCLLNAAAEGFAPFCLATFCIFESLRNGTQDPRAPWSSLLSLFVFFRSRFRFPFVTCTWTHSLRRIPRRLVLIFLALFVTNRSGWNRIDAVFLQPFLGRPVVSSTPGDAVTNEMKVAILGPSEVFFTLAHMAAVWVFLGARAD